MEAGLQKWRLKFNNNKTSITLFSKQTGIRSHSCNIQYVKDFNENTECTRKTEYIRFKYLLQGTYLLPSA